MIIYNSTIYENLIIKLVNYRVCKGLTQKQVADNMGNTKQAVHRLERCNHSPTLKTLNRYIHALGLTYEIRILNKKTGQQEDKNNE